MQKSMTGYGKSTCEFKNKKISIEIKTLNSKGIDLNTRIPSQYKEHELEIRSEIINKLERGKVDFSIFTEQTGAEKNTIINTEIVENYLSQLQKIAKDNNLADTNLLSTVMRLPETLKIDTPEVDETEWMQVRKAIDQTIAETNNFRIQEGAVLVADFVQRIKIIETCLQSIEPLAKERIIKIKDRIKNNIFDVVSKDAVDNNRLEQEIIFYIEKIDITEEQTRLANHCKYFIETIEKECSAGKKLGFISQEIGREINTIGSKSNDYEMQKLVVQMKDELEKIKEQLLNIL
jgi:uncharacterized protein (TIGR00255 family)